MKTLKTLATMATLAASLAFTTGAFAIDTTTTPGPLPDGPIWTSAQCEPLLVDVGLTYQRYLTAIKWELSAEEIQVNWDHYITLKNRYYFYCTDRGGSSSES